MGQTNKFEILQINVSDLIKYNSSLLSSAAIENYRIADSVFFASENNLAPFAATVKAVDDNALFNQVLLESKAEKSLGALYETIVYVKFDVENLEKARFVFSNGFSIRFQSGRLVHFVNFEKSNSMSKDCVLSFINKEYELNMQKRISLDMDFAKNKYVISKLYAYKGLMLSGGTKVGTVKELELDNTSVVIVEDVVKTVPCTVITAVNYSALLKLIDKRLNTQANAEKLENNICATLEAFGIFDNFSYSGNKQQLVSESFRKYLQSASEPSAESFLNGFMDEQFKCKNPRNAFPVDQQWVRVEMEQNVDVNMFDGEGLILKSYADTVINERYAKQKGKSPLPSTRPYSSFQIRLPFVKGMLHSCPFDSFFKKQGVTEIEDYLHNKHDASKVKIILTKSQFKAYSWLKKHCNECGIDNPIAYYWEELQKYNHCLYITGVNNPYANDITLTNYQFLHTPDMTRKDFDEIKSRTEKIYFSLKKDANYRLKYLLGENPFLSSNDSDDETAQISEETDVSNMSIDVLIKKLLTKNSDFVYFPPIAEQIDDVATKIRNDYSLGKLYIDAETRYLSGDLLQLLYSTAKIEMPPFEQLKRDRFYAPKRKNAQSFKAKDGEPGYTFQRNPHLTRNEDVMLKPFLSHPDSVRTRMFGHLNGVVMINPTSLAAERLGGADYDGDIVRIIKNRTYNSCVAKHFVCKNGADFNNSNCLYHAIIIPHTLAKENTYDNDSKFDTIKNTFSSRTGKINNDAFKYSVFAYNSNARDSYEDAKNAEFFSIMTGLEIDSAKSGSKPKLPAKTAKTTLADQRKYFLQYKENPDAFNTKSEIVDFYDFDFDKNTVAIASRNQKNAPSEKTQVIYPANEIPNIMALPYLKLWLSNPKSFPLDTRCSEEKTSSSRTAKGLQYFELAGKACTNTRNIEKMLAACIAYFKICEQLNKKSFNRQAKSVASNNVYTKRIVRTMLMQGRSTITQIQSVDAFVDALSEKSVYELNECIDRMKKINWIFSPLSERYEMSEYIFGDLNVSSELDNVKPIVSDFSYDGYMLLFLMISAAKEQSKNTSTKQKERLCCFADADSVLSKTDIDSFINDTDHSLFSNSEFDKLFFDAYKDMTEFCTQELGRGKTEYRTKLSLNDKLYDLLLQLFGNSDVAFATIMDNLEQSKAFTLVWRIMPKQVYDNARDKEADYVQ